LWLPMGGIDGPSMPTDVVAEPEPERELVPVG
jgi:hypothetical protein